MTDKLKKLESDASNLIHLILKAGADSCDVVVASSDSQSVSVLNGKTEDQQRSESSIAYLRAFCGKKVATVTANRLVNPEQLAERVVAMANFSLEDEYQGLAESSQVIPDSEIDARLEELDLFDNTSVDVKRMEALALATEAAGLKVKGVSKSMGASMAASTSGFVLSTSEGFSGSYSRSSFYNSAAMVAGEGTAMERDYDFDSATYLEDLDDPEKIGRMAGERVVRRINPKQVNSGSFPVVMDPRISSAYLGTLASAINGTSIARKTSFLRDKLNMEVLGNRINVIDDPLLKRRGGSKVFDGEGLAANRIEFVSDGVLQEWVLDCASARELGLESNGRAVRGGGGTAPGTTNLYMEPGEKTPEQLIGEIEKGLYVTETIGHGINMVTGDYSKGAAGFWIENGEIQFPVSEVTIAGNLANMFRGTTAASDLEFKFRTNAPTLVVEGMTIGGK